MNEVTFFMFILLYCKSFFACTSETSLKRKLPLDHQRLPTKSRCNMMSLIFHISIYYWECCKL